MKEWKNEPDYVSFQYKGYICEIWRHPVAKYLCGYVSLPLRHSLYGKDTDELDFLEVHGGITFAEFEQRPFFPATYGKYKIGFDCGHCCDLVPLLYEEHGIGGDTEYHNIKYVENELKKLVDQLEDIHGKINRC